MHVPSIVKRLMLVPGLALFGALGNPGAAGATPATASLSSVVTYDLPPCKESWLVDGIALRTYNDGDFKIAVRPSAGGRWWGNWLNNPNQVWHEVQACVPGLAGTVADRIYAQLVCHAKYSVVPNTHFNGWATGETWDLESWLTPTTLGDSEVTNCSNKTNNKEHESGFWHIYFGPDPEGYDPNEGKPQVLEMPETLPPYGPSNTVSVAFTQGLGLWTRTSPDRGAGLIEVLPEGTQMELICQTHGENVSDWITSDIWDKVRLGNGSEVWVSDVFVNTGTNELVGPTC